jgi:hypothetical protein
VSRREDTPGWRALAERLGTVDPLVALAIVLGRPAADPELAAGVAAWVGAEATDAQAATRLLELEAATVDKAVRREVRRALYRLEQRGTWNRPATPAPPKTSALLGAFEGEPEAWLTEIDPGGTRLLWLARRRGEAVASLSAVVNDLRGVLELNAGETRRKAIRDAHRSLTAKTGLALVEAPWRHVDGVLEAALALSPDETRNADVARAREAILPPGERGAIDPPIGAILDRAAILADLDALVQSPAVRHEGQGPGWLVPFEWLEAAADTVAAARESLVVVSPAQQEERVRTALENAREEIFTVPERRALFARRFSESAWIAARRGQESRARSLWACALALEAGRPVSSIPAVDEMTRLSLAFALEARAKRASEESRSSLIVTPAQAMAEARRPPGR